ncbi:ArsR/SmtB family transcription factor [Paenibacillus glacialis]|uniref:Transcriptional regulator n=1 Tax=Paenibacillus glacialis TaxID=494026 RepID=A0A168KNT9_9BACL|nr:helix-turn-helix transcriptional regulator [Paenibacillus glacialis]OAB42274.1 transcriptional regulator [Paenibacillus glacialis]
MTYHVEIQFHPIHELMNSLHSFICKKSHKKTELGSSWAKETENQLNAELSSRLEATELNNDWKTLYLLIHLCPHKESVTSVLKWIEGLSIGQIYEALSEYVKIFPSNMNDYRNQIMYLLYEWNLQYFSRCSPTILEALQQHSDDKKLELAQSQNTSEVVNTTTNGFYFVPVEGLETVVLVPQYHFQPANIIYSYGKLTLCQYASRISLGEENDISAYMYRTIRSLGEKSRLKILQSLHGERKTFTEIVKSAGLSKGIVHDHIFNLRSSGLLHAYIEGENVTDYSLRLEGIRHMNNQILDYLQP